MPRKRNDQGVPASTASAMITPLDIQQKEFQVSRFGGYRMRDVDEFLDELTDAMSAVLAENERLRAGGSSSIVGSPDLDEVSRQADEIIQRARDEAARIVADANEHAASLGGELASGPVTAADRAAVDAFLARERGFLQSLAALVQEHADGVKGMARDVRRRSAPSEAAAAVAPAATPAPRPDAPQATAAAGDERSTRPAAASQEAAEPPRGPSPTEPPAVEPPATEPSATSSEASPTDTDATRRITPVPPADEPIVVSDPEPARSRRDDDGRDESLRELFWGEES